MSAVYGSPYDVVANSGVTERSAFIRKVYGHLAGAIALLVALEYVVLNSPLGQTLSSLIFSGGRFGWLGILGGFMIVSWLATSFASNPGSKALQYTGLGLYTVAWSILLAPILLVAARMGSDILPKALACTGAVFGGLTMVAFFTRADFSFFRSFLMIGGFVALGAIICGAIFNFDLGLWFSAAMVLMASVSILYNTSEIIHNYRSDQYVAAALSLFGSVVMLFWYILRIFMSREE